MSFFLLNKNIVFPPADQSRFDGLLAIGGDLSTERLLYAYKNGIFPWYSDEPILWWSPDPRLVLFPEELYVSSSMKKMIRQNKFQFTFNSAFKEVIRNCKLVQRNDQDGTWITDEMEEAYIKLNDLGYAISGEVWEDGELVGGIYGVKLGKVFFGESMFHHKTNASKFALIRLLEHLKKEGIKLMDCQVHTDHLESLGAKMISRVEFISLLKNFIT